MLPERATGVQSGRRAKIINVSVSHLTLVVRADPDFQRLKHRQLEYECSNRRQFYADLTVHGAYEHNK